MKSGFLLQTPSKGLITLPARRTLPPDITNPSFEDLIHLALVRVFDAASPFENRPPRMFPTAETVFGKYFTHDDWLVHGDLETELGRMNYMILNLPERGIPSSCIGLIRPLLSSDSVLIAWERTLPWLKSRIKQETQRLTHKMQKEQVASVADDPKSEFIALPVDYEVHTTSPYYTLQLWERALSEIVIQALIGRFKQAKAFLQIFSFLRDPLGGLESVSDKAVELFSYMMMMLLTDSACRTPGSSLVAAGWRAAAAQAAQEAIFLAFPLAEKIDYVHFSGHQQLLYTYVPLDRLPRSEFSIPGHVCSIVEEILSSESSQHGAHCLIAPIAVSSYPTLPIEDGKYATVILDGNHRATATMVLRLIAEHPTSLTTEQPQHLLDAFCTTHKLGVKWKLDLSEVLSDMRSNHYKALTLRKWNLVERFRKVTTIPALIVREDNFHTVCQQRPGLGDRPRLLLPIHQALYNDERLGLAFPNAGQVHGRAVGFKGMPLLWENDDDDEKRIRGCGMQIDCTGEPESR